MAKSINVFEHERLLIGQQGFKQNHWKTFVKLNELHDGAYFDVLHNGLKFKQYVGVLQVDGLLVQIHPKADQNDSDESWRNVLLQMLKRCGRIKADHLGDAYLKKQRVNLLEVYFEMYLKEVEQLLHSGLIKKYRRQTENVPALKGKLEFAGHIRKNLVHQERFYTSHQVYDRDHLLHQVLHCALRIVRDFSGATGLYGRCQRTLLDFPEVKQILPNACTLNGVRMDRKSAPYTRAFELARLIILHFSPDISGGKNNMIALLFNMNELWEEFVLKELQTYARYPGLPISVSGQETKTFWGNRTIRPDIVLDVNGEKIVVDTKWKRPKDNRPSIEDVRQMYGYARFWNAQKVVLLYPGADAFSEFIPYRNEELDRNNHKCKVQTINILDGNNNLKIDLGKKIIDLILPKLT